MNHFTRGGAANVARNLREFVDCVAIIGLLGTDRGGQQLRELLSERKIDTSNVVEEATFRTIVKTRIIARHQQVVRVDREKFVGPSAPQIEEVVAAVRKNIPETDEVYFRRLRQRFPIDPTGFANRKCCTLGRQNRRCGSQSPNLVEWRGLTVIKPNRDGSFSRCRYSQRRAGCCRVPRYASEAHGGSAAKKMGSRKCSHHPGRTWHDAFPKEQKHPTTFPPKQERFSMYREQVIRPSPCLPWALPAERLRPKRRKSPTTRALWS